MRNLQEGYQEHRGKCPEKVPEGNDCLCESVAAPRGGSRRHIPSDEADQHGVLLKYRERLRK